MNIWVAFWKWLGYRIVFMQSTTELYVNWAKPVTVIDPTTNEKITAYSSSTHSWGIGKVFLFPGGRVVGASYIIRWWIEE